MTVPVVLDINPGDVLKLVLRMHFRGQAGLNVFWYRVDDATISTTYYAQLTNWYGVAFPLYRPLLTGGVQIRDATMQIFTGGAARTPTLFMQPDFHDGAGGDNPIPTQVSGLVTRRINTTNNTNRGRVYVPFPDTSAIDIDETPTDGYVALLVAMAAALLPVTAPMTVGGQVWSPVLYQVGTGLATDLLDVQGQKMWATQRRRGDYGRLNN